MMTIKHRDDGLIEVRHEDFFSMDDWREYQAMMLTLLDAAEQRLYILSDFSRTPTFDPALAREMGTAQHLAHPRLGLLVLLGGNTLSNFALQVTEGRAERNGHHARLRIHTDRQRALATLRQQKALDANRNGSPT